MNNLDFARVAITARLRGQSDANVRDDAAADLARCTETAKAMLTQGRSLVLPESYSERDALADAGFDETPTDGEILDVYVENFGGTREQAIERLALFDAVVARAEFPLPGGQHYSTTTFKDNGEPILLNADGSRSIFCDVAD